MKAKFIIIVLFYTVIISSCSTTDFNVVNIKQANYDNDAIIYSLPKTAIQIKVEIDEIHKQRGPFYMYAKKYFGTEDVIKSDLIESKISKVSMTTSPIPDPEQNYAVIPGDGSNVHLINLTTDGYITGVNLKDIQIKQFDQSQDDIQLTDQENGKLSYADLSVWSVREAKYDTLYKEVFQDSVFVKMPIVRKTMVYKSTEKQAEELANQIFLLRDDRNALLKGEGDGNKLPDGEAIKIMIDKLDKLEEEYMNLFTGKTNKVTKYYGFIYVPNKDSINTSEVLFKFTRKYGVMPINDEKGSSVSLRIVKEKNKDNVTNFVSLHKSKKLVKKQTQNGIFYRIPENANVEIMHNGNVLFRKRFNIAQFGSVNTLPLSIFKKSISIEFYPEYGSLKSISRDKNPIIIE